MYDGAFRLCRTELARKSLLTHLLHCLFDRLSFCTSTTDVCASQVGKDDEAELSIQNVLEEINKGFKTSAQDDKVFLFLYDVHLQCMKEKQKL